MSFSALFQEPEVFITVCSSAGVVKYGKHSRNLDRRLEMNWNNFEDHQPGDIVALFDCDPENKDFRINNSNKVASIIDLARETVEVKARYQFDPNEIISKLLDATWIDSLYVLLKFN